jgi:hypothetical protein
LDNITRSSIDVNDRRRHLTVTGEGEMRSTATPSRERTWDSGSGPELHRSTQIGGEDRRLQNALRPRHLHHSAAGSHTTTPYAMYTT